MRKPFQTRLVALRKHAVRQEKAKSGLNDVFLCYETKADDWMQKIAASFVQQVKNVVEIFTSCHGVIYVCVSLLEPHWGTRERVIG